MISIWHNAVRDEDKMTHRRQDGKTS